MCLLVYLNFSLIKTKVTFYALNAVHVQHVLLPCKFKNLNPEILFKKK